MIVGIESQHPLQAIGFGGRRIEDVAEPQPAFLRFRIEAHCLRQKAAGRAPFAQAGGDDALTEK